MTFGLIWLFEIVTITIKIELANASINRYKDFDYQLLCKKKFNVGIQ